jgi:hypothetical protein
MLSETATAIIFEENCTTVTDARGLSIIQLKRKLCGQPPLVEMQLTITRHQ